MSRLPGSAIFGGVVWAAFAAGRHLHWADLSLIELLFLFALLVIVPLGMKLVPRLGSLDRSLLHVLAEFGVPVAAVFAALAFLFPVGKIAAVLAAPWLLLTLLLGTSGLSFLLRGRDRPLPLICAAVGLLYLPVGGAWLGASRLGLTPMRFEEPIVLLTAAHFHYAGFAACLIGGVVALLLTQSSTVVRRVLRLVLPGVLLGPGFLAVGFVIGPLVKLVAALLLALSLLGLSLLLLFFLRSVGSRPAQAFFALASISTCIAMVLAGVWADGEYPLQPFLNLPQMALLHGTINAFGFCLCGLLGGLLAGPVRREPRCELP